MSRRIIPSLTSHKVTRTSSIGVKIRWYETIDLTTGRWKLSFKVMVGLIQLLRISSAPHRPPRKNRTVVFGKQSQGITIGKGGGGPSRNDRQA
jgi:hypothetical protein